MKVISVRNVNHAFHEGMGFFSRHVYWKEKGWAQRDPFENILEQESRNGPVLVAEFPVTTVYSHPLERVLFSAKRDANPFFHLFESLWMLAGRNDVEYVAQFNKRMRQYSDDGTVLNGAYGHRWRYQFEDDQLEFICTLLKNNPDSRRAVLSMWDANFDLVYSEEGSSKDLPCNTEAFFRLQPGSPRTLDMTVLCRSNDMIWGCYGANAVHFSFLLEYMAARLNAKPGRYIQVSNNFHVYKDVFTGLLPVDPEDIKRASQVYPMESLVPLVRDIERFHLELEEFIKRSDTTEENKDRIVNGQYINKDGFFVEPFFKGVACPLYHAYYLFRPPVKHLSIWVRGKEAIDFIDEHCISGDWSDGATEWIERRMLR